MALRQLPAEFALLYHFLHILLPCSQNLTLSHFFALFHLPPPKFHFVSFFALFHLPTPKFYFCIIFCTFQHTAPKFQPSLPRWRCANFRATWSSLVLLAICQAHNSPVNFRSVGVTPTLKSLRRFAKSRAAQPHSDKTFARLGVPPSIGPPRRPLRKKLPPLPMLAQRQPWKRPVNFCFIGVTPILKFLDQFPLSWRSANFPASQSAPAKIFPFFCFCPCWRSANIPRHPCQKLPFQLDFSTFSTKCRPMRHVFPLKIGEKPRFKKFLGAITA